MLTPSCRPWPWLLGCLFTMTGLSDLQAQAAPADGSRVVRDLPYVTGGSAQQRLDLYLPAADKTPPPRPLVVWIHGGGWESGDRHDCLAQPLVQRGYVVASLDYRLSAEAIYPAQIEDCKAAVRWLRAHAGEYGIDPARIGVWGASAGGHLVALLGTTGGNRRFDVGANPDQSSRVQCVLDWFGPTDFLHWDEPPADTALNDPKGPFAHLVGGPMREREELARAASPIYYVDEHSAPFLILQGDQDQVVPAQQSIILDAALKKAGVESTLVIVKGAGHGGPLMTSPENVKLMGDFFDRHLRPGSPR